MRLLTWNILHGGGSTRMPKITLRLLGHQPDIAVITEFRARTGGQIAGVLADHGLQYQASTSVPALGQPIARASRRKSAGLALSPTIEINGNGILIASRFPLETDADSGPPKALKHKWLSVVVKGPGIRLAGVHVPDDSRPTDKAAAWHHLLGYARAHKDQPCAVLGDFNTGRHFEDEAGATFGATDLLGTLWTLGFRDAWRQLHPQDREFTWYSHTGAGFRIDHAFLSPPLLAGLTSAQYSHAERELRVSDHSALLVDLA